MGLDLTPPPVTFEQAADDPLIGVELGNFKILERIAEGGMGVIYRAVNTLIGRQAAVKVLTPKYSSDRNMIKRLHREAVAVNQIGHPNIIDIFDFGQTPDHREFFVMEYLPGRTLAQFLERRPRLPWAVTEQIFRQVLDALAAAHSYGIIHRDIKPENIQVVPLDDGTVLAKILDFGIAKSIGLGPIGEQLTRAGSVMGTPEYIAPEQIRGKELDGRADLYSLGVILFETVMGQRPFTSKKVISLLMAHLREPVPAMDDIPAELGVPAYVADVVRQAMAKEVDDRFADAHAFAAAMGLEIAQVSATAGTQSLPEIHLPSEDTATAHGGALRAPQATMPGAGPLPTQISPTTSARSPWRLIPPLAVLVLAVLAIAGKVFLWHHRSQASNTIAAPPPADAGAPTATEFKPVGDLGALANKVRRVLRQGIQATEATLRRASARATGKLHDADAHAMLVAVLKEDPDPTVRAAAALALVDGGDPTAAATLRQARSQNSEYTRVAIDEALMRLGQNDGRDALVAALRDARRAVRLPAALALAEAGDERALPVLLEAIAKVEALEQPALVAVVGMAARLGHADALKTLHDGLKRDDKAVIQLGCAEALAKVGDDAGVAILRQLLESKTAATQLVAARLLAALGDYQGLDLLKHAIRDRDEQTRALAASALAAVADRAALPPLAEALDDPKPPVRTAAADALAQIFALMPDELVRRSQDWVFAALERGDWAMRHAALGVTAEMDPELAVELLGWALRDADPGIRAAAVARLGRLRTKSDRAVKILSVALTDDSADVRASAAAALGRLAGEDAKGALAVAVRDRDTRVGIIAAGQLLALGDTRHLEDLKQATRLANPALRAQAVRAIGEWKDAKATPLLLKALKDRSDPVRTAAAIALAQRGARQGVKVLQAAIKAGGALGEEAFRALAKLGVSQEDRLRALAAAKDPASREAAMDVVDTAKAAVAADIVTRGAADREVAVRRAAARAAARLATRHPALRRVLKDLARDPDPAVRATAAVGLAKLRRQRAGSAPGVAPVKPAPLPEGRRAPQRVVPRDTKKPLFVDDTARVDRYKFHISNAEALKRRGKFTAALKQLRLAQRSMDKAPVHFDFGLVHLKIAQQQLRRNPKVAQSHLRRARTSFQTYLRRAPAGKLATRARGGLRDVARLSSVIR